MAGVDVGTAYLTVVPSFKNFGSKLSSQLDGGAGFSAAGKKAGDSAAKGFGGSFTSGLKSVIGPAAALIGGLGAVNFLKDSVGEAREAQKVGALTAQVIKTTGGAAKVSAGQVENLATAISNKTGIDDEAIQSASNLLLTFTNLRNETGKGNDVFNQATQAATDMSAALGGDPRDNAIKLGKALNDPVKGITALSKAGVSFTQQQKDQIKTLVDSGKTLDAQKIILGELNKEFGGAAEASTTAGEKMKVSFGNLKEQIGTALLPAVDKFATLMTKKVIPAITDTINILTKGDLSSTVEDAFGLTEDSAFVGFLLKIRDTAKIVIPQIKAGFGGLKSAFSGEGVTSNGFVGFMEKAGVVARQVFDYLKVAIPPIIAAAVALWPAIKEIGVQLFEASKGSGLSTFQLLKVALEALPGILNAILPLVENLARWMGENQEFVSALVVALTAGVAAFKVLAVVARAYAVVQGILNVVLSANPIGLIVIAIAALVAGLIYAYQNSETFRDIVNGAFEAIGNVIRFVYNTIIQPVLTFFLEMIANIMRSFGDFLIMLGNVPGFDWAREAGEKIKGAADQVTLLSDKIQKIPDKEVRITLAVDAEAAVEGKIDGVIAGIAARAGRNASGTPYWKGGLTWVGEEGPELLNLPRGSQILSNEDSRALVASQATVFQPTVSPTSAVKGEPTVQQNFNGPIVAHDYDDFQRKMADQRRLGALAGRRA